MGISKTSIIRRLALLLLGLALIAGWGMAAERAVKCIWCSGTGKRPLGKSCDSCNGTGTKWEHVPNGSGGETSNSREQAVKCIWCSGSGKRPLGKQCDNCNGTGVCWERPSSGGINSGRGK